MDLEKTKMYKRTQREVAGSSSSRNITWVGAALRLIVAMAGFWLLLMAAFVGSVFTLLWYFDRPDSSDEYIGKEQEVIAVMARMSREIDGIQQSRGTNNDSTAGVNALVTTRGYVSGWENRIEFKTAGTNATHYYLDYTTPNQVTLHYDSEQSTKGIQRISD